MNLMHYLTTLKIWMNREVRETAHIRMVGNFRNDGDTSAFIKFQESHLIDKFTGEELDYPPLLELKNVRLGYSLSQNKIYEVTPSYDLINEGRGVIINLGAGFKVFDFSYDGDQQTRHGAYPISPPKSSVSLRTNRNQSLIAYYNSYFGFSGKASGYTIGETIYLTGKFDVYNPFYRETVISDVPLTISRIAR